MARRVTDLTPVSLNMLKKLSTHIKKEKTHMCAETALLDETRNKLSQAM